MLTTNHSPALDTHRLFPAGNQRQPAQADIAQSRLNNIQPEPRLLRAFGRIHTSGNDANTLITANTVGSIDFSRLRPAAHTFEDTELCGISLEPLQNLQEPAVLNNRLYDLASLKAWLRTNPRDPINANQPVRLGDIQRLGAPPSSQPTPQPTSQATSPPAQNLAYKLSRLLKWPSRALQLLEKAYMRHRLIRQQLLKFEHLTVSSAQRRRLLTALKALPAACCTAETFNLLVPLPQAHFYSSRDRDAKLSDVIAFLGAFTELPPSKQNAQFVGYISEQL